MSADNWDISPHCTSKPSVSREEKLRQLRGAGFSDQAIEALMILVDAEANSEETKQ